MAVDFAALPAIPPALFLAGLLGGPHCFGMCGGIVGALGGMVSGQGSRWSLHLGYHLGRLATYTLLGGLAGAVGAVLLASGAWQVRAALLLLAGLLLIGMGLYLLGLPRFLSPLERAGATLWRKVQPLGKSLLPVRSAVQALALGLIWGWLPCGLVYTALTSAMASGTAASGALAMLAFGLGTLPNMLLAGLFAARIRPHLQKKWVRAGAGLLIGAYGLNTVLGALRIAATV